MFEFCFFRDAYEGAGAAAPVPDEVVAVLVVDLGMEARHILIDDVYLVFAVPADHPPVFFQRIAAIY